MQDLRPLREFLESKSVNVLKEDNQEGGKDLYIEGVFLEGDIQNRNGRIYPVPMLEKAVDTFLKTKVRGVGVPGELNHPQSSIQIDLDRVSHYITSLRMEKNQGIGKAKIATTPKGMIARSLINDGMILGVSTRGVGKLDQDQQGRDIVSDFDLITIDIVSDPSAPNAYVEAVMEGLRYYIDSDTKDIKLSTNVEQLLEMMMNNLSTLPKKQEDKSQKIYKNISQLIDLL